eukprot:853641_1
MSHVTRQIPQSTKRLSSKSLMTITSTNRFHSLFVSNQQSAIYSHTHTLSIERQHQIHTLSSYGKFRKFQNISSNQNKQPTNMFNHCIQYFNAASSQKKDYYETLGVDKNAKDTEIKKAFYKLAKQWHPDANKAPEAKDKFSEINEAYQILSNKEKRAQYDRFGHDMGGMGGMG